ncbi:hypothetical protein NDU88_002131 [Pleurodeles waltl]|uniref:Uncharacterized protein n=1 Tax=Pleurodeles waltl TaxID=8319 RepID=A0AAV7SCC9_PLEWA|nr:hypothetical protein NDU88_002131 [Pleurodeles waltl]
MSKAWARGGPVHARPAHLECSWNLYTQWRRNSLRRLLPLSPLGQRVLDSECSDGDPGAGGVQLEFVRQSRGNSWGQLLPLSPVEQRVLNSECSDGDP